MVRVNRYGRTETTVREFDQAGRLLSETVTTVEERPVIEKPPGFVPPLARAVGCEVQPAG